MFVAWVTNDNKAYDFNSAVTGNLTLSSKWTGTKKAVNPDGSQTTTTANGDGTYTTENAGAGGKTTTNVGKPTAGGDGGSTVPVTVALPNGKKGTSRVVYGPDGVPSRLIAPVSDGTLELSGGTKWKKTGKYLYAMK